MLRRGEVQVTHGRREPSFRCGPRAGDAVPRTLCRRCHGAAAAVAATAQPLPSLPRRSPACPLPFALAAPRRVRPRAARAAWSGRPGSLLAQCLVFSLRPVRCHLYGSLQFSNRFYIVYCV